MRSKDVYRLISSLYPKRRTLCIEGSPGGGKTTIVRQVAQSLGIGYVELHMPTTLVEDFGIPFPQQASDTMEFMLPDWYPKTGAGILCFDDRNQANADLQKVLANICQARTLHGVELPEGWMVVSTGNRQSDRAGANRVLSHLRNRETVIEMETHLDDWTEWAISNDVPAEGISFIRFRPELLHEFDPKRDVNPTPRSWVEGVFDLLEDIPKGLEFECFKGAVGEGAAAEFTGYLKIYRELPDPQAIIKNPDAHKIPDSPATLYALSGALGNIADRSNFDNILKYTSRMPKEFNVLTVSYATKRNPEVTETSAFIQWAVDQQDLLF